MGKSKGLWTCSLKKSIVKGKENLLEKVNKQKHWVCNQADLVFILG